MRNINQSLIMTVSIVLMAIGVLYQVAIGVAYQKMIQATDTMMGTDNKLLKQCKEPGIGIPGDGMAVADFLRYGMTSLHGSTSGIRICAVAPF